MSSFDTVWEDIHSTQDWGQYPSEHIIRFIARNYYKTDRINTRILDFCCGGGANTWYLCREGFDVYAFDGSKSAVAKVEEKLNKDNLQATLNVYDATETDYPDDFFDAIIDGVSVCANTISNIIIMYRAIYNMLKSQGRLQTSMFTGETTGSESGEIIEEGTYRNLKEGNLAGRGTIHFFTETEIKGLLEEIGFKDIVVDTMRYSDRGNMVSLLIVQAVKP